MPLGANFTAVCVLKEKCMDYFHVNADYIFWKTNHVTVPREQYTVINSTAASVTFTDVPLMNTQLTCNIRTFGQIDQNVYGIRVLSGRESPCPWGVAVGCVAGVVGQSQEGRGLVRPVPFGHTCL